MKESPKEYVLRIVRGPGKGQKFQLTKAETTIGTGNVNDLVQDGQYMSETHAVIEKRGEGSWYLTNRSPNGTFVNRNRVDTHVLGDGDFVQMGSEVLLQFGVAEVKKKSGLLGGRKKRDSSGSDEDEKPSIIKQKPGLVFGIGGYFLAVVALVIYFMITDFSEVTPGLDQAEVQTAIAQTRELLLAQEDLPDRYLVDTNSDDTALFYSIIASGKLEGQSAARDQMIDQLVAEIDSRYFLAWRLEKRNQLDLAVEEYERIMELAPDIRIPTTSLASRRLAYIRGVIISG